MPQPRGKFITFEGLDGVGKSTQLENLAKYLRDRGVDVITTREPGGTHLGEILRPILVSSRTSKLCSYAELALMFADRAQHIDEQILPALVRGQWVLCDRFTDSSEAYQGGGRELGSEIVLQLHKTLCHDLQPDLTILMSSDVARTVARARRRNIEQIKLIKEDESRFEKENREFYERVWEAYLNLSLRNPHRIVTIDARKPIDQVCKQIVKLVTERFRINRAK